MTTSLKVEPAAATAQKGYYRLQVAALRDERQAQDLARRLERSSGQPGEAYFDAGIDLYRVRVGRYATREAAEADMRRLGAIGVTGAFVVNEGGSVTEPALRLTQGQTTTTYPGRWLSVSPVGNPSVRVRNKRYRGRVLVYLNDRGALNLINELPVEDYLRGVVPSEMGPELYNQLEALKAQAVAARTYALRNLGEFSREGYDICATPRCQVYGGMNVEHPLSDRAISETAGQVLLYKGELVDALYSSTCGGHTEDVHVIFPLKQGDDTCKAVPCMEVGVVRIEGDLAPGVPFPAGLTRRLLPPAAGASPAGTLGARLEHLALLAGLPAPRERLASLDRREVQRYVSSAFDLALDARLFVAPEDVKLSAERPAPRLERGGPPAGGLPDQERPGERAARPAARRGRGRADAPRPRRAAARGAPRGGPRSSPSRTAGSPSAPARRTRSTTCRPASPPSAARGTTSTARPSPWSRATT